MPEQGVTRAAPDHTHDCEEPTRSSRRVLHAALGLAEPRYRQTPLSTALQDWSIPALKSERLRAV